MLLRGLLDVLFPPLCHVCRKPVPEAGELHLCPDCRGAMTPVASPCCPVCGIPFGTEGGIDHPCGDCLTAPPPFDAARGALVFAGPVQELIHRFKYGHKVHLRRPLALLAVEHLTPFVRGVAPDLIVPVPLHRVRLRERGFNQAILIGEVMARHWGAPLLRDTLRRVRPTAPQVALSAPQRRENVRGAFSVAVPERVEGRRVLLVDDVCTTGSTLAECARVLRRAGVASVAAVTVARAP
ncbi:ComF family protein [Geobacter pickeringii]|uniref:ComF family protein n=1 Tax=Geobacter pickeringii TaxID=345632 RepID=UPI001184E92C|nr:ComF family protein [Geobacter pickeringii]